MKVSFQFRATMLSILILVVLLGIWQVSTAPAESAQPITTMTAAEAEYAALMGLPVPGQDSVVQKNDSFPTPAQFGAVALQHLSAPFYDNGPNDKGIGIQLLHSLARVAIGYLLAMAVAIPLGFVIGMSPLLYKALDPFIQVLKPISPLAWMPIALYTIKDSSVSGIFVIFICSIWPMLINTAFGVAGVRKDWLNVARTLEVKPLRRAFCVILPAAAPTIITGMRISMGIAWLLKC